MNDFTPLSALAGGALIGVAATLALLTHGRVVGISGLFGALLRRQAGDRAFASSFLAGMVLIGLAARSLVPFAFTTTWSATLPVALGAGVLVGLGTQLGSGCTSGHGVCGISRVSGRSLLATVVFMATGGATVFVVRHVLPGAL